MRESSWRAAETKGSRAGTVALARLVVST